MRYLVDRLIASKDAEEGGQQLNVVVGNTGMALFTYASPFQSSVYHNTRFTTEEAVEFAHWIMERVRSYEHL
jgi:hypothetical protein